MVRGAQPLDGKVREVSSSVARVDRVWSDRIAMASTHMLTPIAVRVPTDGHRRAKPSEPRCFQDSQSLRARNRRVPSSEYWYQWSGRSSGLLGSATKARLYFDDLRQKSPAAVRPVIDQLEALCQRRSELALQERLQFWLHAWLLVHLPLSVVLVVVLIGHVYFALQFG